MARILWDETGKHFFEAGVDRGVFYPIGGVGYPWNGLISVREAPSIGDTTKAYYDGLNYHVQKPEQSFSGELSAYTYPLEFAPFDGSKDQRLHQNRQPFNLTYRTLKGNDIAGLGSAYYIHLLFNVLVSPSDRDNQSQNADASGMVFTWSLSTRAEIVPDYHWTAHVIIDSSLAYPSALSRLEDMLYGTSETVPEFPTMDTLIAMFEEESILRIINHGDGTWTAIGPDDVVKIISPTEFEITWPSVVYLNPTTYKISSL